MYEDRDYSRSSSQRPGAWRSLIPRAGNILDWALPVARVFGVTVRLHLFFLVFIVLQLAVAGFSSGGLGIQFVAMGLICLFVSVLIHEFGHVFACRAVGGQADDVLLWPLGGLASCRPPHTWKASLATTLGGPLVHPLLMIPAAFGILAMGGSGASLLFNPFDINAAFITFQKETFVQGTSDFVALLKTSVWWFYYTNLVLLCFNMLLPMFPMDAGRVLQELLWSRLGFRRSMKIAASVGLGVAICVGLYGLVGNRSTLFGLALFAGFTCWSELQRLRFQDAAALEDSRTGGGFAQDPAYAAALAEQQRADREEESGRERRKRELARQREEAAKHQDELDRILAKISREGMAALTRSEKKFLEQDTTRRREAR
jgi:stage IV sporulation protein FB